MNYGKRAINDALKHRSMIERKIRVDGERRTEKVPWGRVERFVDLAGNVCTHQLSTPAGPAGGPGVHDPNLDFARMKIRADGWVDHGRCPLRHGTYRANADVSAEFAAMPAELQDPCVSDPTTHVRKNGEVHAQEACPHIEWLIADRRRRDEEDREKRNAGQIRNERRLAERAELDALQIEMMREQVAEHQKRKGKSK